MKHWLLACFVLLFTALEAGAQTRVVQGRVFDTSNNPLLGVTVVDKEGTSGTTTDVDGNFRLSVPADATILFTYIGYVTQEFPASAVPAVVTMPEDTQALDEVVVVGY
ncbi:MAG: carboxypeptidase-like regulatory domain-containing protein, partial [Alistipes sp.]|nr:carboxypeptidase-like regulatory domain-containing protein [Alistipes sp.]